MLELYLNRKRVSVKCLPRRRAFWLLLSSSPPNEDTEIRPQRVQTRHRSLPLATLGALGASPCSQVKYMISFSRELLMWRPMTEQW